MKAAYDNFFRQYSDSMGEQGDECHQNYIDPAVYSIVGNPS